MIEHKKIKSSINLPASVYKIVDCARIGEKLDMKSYKELSKEYEDKQLEAKNRIKQEPKRAKRILKWCWYLMTFPFTWIWVNIRDFKTLIIFALVVIVVSSEVWVPYLLGFIFNNSWLIGLGTTCWLFWLGPGTPFLVICIFLTIAIKGLFNKIRGHKDGN